MSQESSQFTLSQLNAHIDQIESQHEKDIILMNTIIKLKKKYLKVRVKSEQDYLALSEDDVLTNKKNYIERLHQLKTERKMRNKLFKIYYQSKYSQYHKTSH